MLSYVSCKSKSCLNKQFFQDRIYINDNAKCNVHQLLQVETPWEVGLEWLSVNYLLFIFSTVTV